MVNWLAHTIAKLGGAHGFLHAKTYLDPPVVPEVVPEPQHVDHHDWNMSPTMYAFVFCTVSGLSLPIGSALGIYFSPVSPTTCSMMMAFGAGALLFAVTVEMYGHALTELVSGRSGLYEMVCTVGGALLGCAFYIVTNNWLEAHLEEVEEAQQEGSPRRPTVAEHLQKEQEVLSSIKEAGREEFRKVRSLSVPNLNPSTPRLNWLPEVCDHSVARPRQKVLVLDPQEAEHAKSVALALFLGLFLDGVPEGILMGFLAAEHHLTPVLIVSLFIANFPEAFSSASLLIQAQMPVWKIVGMWSGLCLLVGLLGFLSCLGLTTLFPEFGQGGFESHSLPVPVLTGIALIEGITGGAMLACISGVMLPEAFERGGKRGPFYQQSGFMCVSVSFFAVLS